jgi:hypothetical protein
MRDGPKGMRLSLIVHVNTAPHVNIAPYKQAMVYCLRVYPHLRDPRDIEQGATRSRASKARDRVPLGYKKATVHVREAPSTVETSFRAPSSSALSS